MEDISFRCLFIDIVALFSYIILFSRELFLTFCYVPTGQTYKTIIFNSNMKII